MGILETIKNKLNETEPLKTINEATKKLGGSTDQEADFSKTEEAAKKGAETMQKNLGILKVDDSIKKIP
jgi:hypothetical protein